MMNIRPIQSRGHININIKQAAQVIMQSSIEDTLVRNSLYISNQKTRYRLMHGNDFNAMLDPRDKVLEHIFNFIIPFSVQDVSQHGLLKSQLYIDIMTSMHGFLVETISNVVSVSFDFYANGKLKEREAKEYASKNMILNIQSIFGATIKAIQSNQELKQNIIEFARKIKNQENSIKKFNQNKNSNLGAQSNDTLFCNALKDLKTKMAIDCDFIVTKTLKNLAALYPMAPTVGGTPRMREIILDVNRSDDQENDLIQANQISIKKYLKIKQNQYIKNRQQIILGDNDDFTEFIMEVINTIMIVTQSNDDRLERTTMQVFTQFNQKLFWSSKQKIVEKAYKSSKKDQSQDATIRQCLIDFFTTTLQRKDQNFVECIEKRNTQLLNIIFQKKSSEEEKLNIQKESFIHSTAVGAKQQIQLMKNKPTFAIGQKIPGSVKPYTLEQISNKQFAGKHSSLLRILTKWAQYLESILKKPEQFVHNRKYPLKNINGETCFMIYDFQKVQLIKQLQKQTKQVAKKFEQLKRRSYELIGEFLGAQEKDQKNKLKRGQILDILNSMSSVNRYSQTRTASSKINAVLTQLTLKYLSVLIYHLIKVGRQIHTDKNEQDNLNLISFRVTDLMRSKIQCKQQEFINLLQTMYLLDDCSQLKGKFKLVRIKNRLDTHASDVMINFLFDCKVQCEMQVSIQQPQDKQKKYYTFSHFVYELTRGSFGAIAECAIMVSQLDNMIAAKKQGSYYVEQKENKKSYQNLKKIDSSQGNKNNSQAYICSKTSKLIINEVQGLFEKDWSNPVCNQSILKQPHPEEYVEDKKARQLIGKLLKDGALRRIKKLKQLKTDHKLCLAVFNAKQKKLCFSLIVKSQSQMKTYKVNISPMDLKLINENRYDYSKISYKDITAHIKANKPVSELMFQWNPQHENKQLFNILGFDYTNTDDLIEGINDFIDNFFELRRQIQIAKSIKSKPDIISLDSDLETSLATMTEAYINQSKKNDLKYKGLKKIDFSSVTRLQAKWCQLQQTPVWLHMMKNLQIINLSSNNLKEPKLRGLQKVQKLDLSSNQLTQLSLEQLPLNINYLDLSQNNLTKLNIQHLPAKIKEFRLSQNNFSQINLQHLPQGILNLYLSKNILTQVDLEHLPESLVYLDLSDNKISQINIHKIPKDLKYLDLDNNQLVKIDFNLASDANLNQLSLANNKLTQINLGSLPNNLSILNLQSNQIQDIQGLQYLPISLTRLNLQRNKLTEVNLESLPSNLIYINLSYNQLTEANLSQLPPSINNIDLSHNSLTQVLLQNLPACLLSLRLNTNKLSEINLKNLPYTLIQFDISQNPFEQVILQNLPPNLKQLGLSDTQLTQVDIDNLPQSLLQLNLGRNKLTKINIQNLPSHLTTLYLDANELTQVDLQHLPSNLQYIHLHKNKLTDVNLKHLPSTLRELSLDSNLLKEVDLQHLPSNLQQLHLEQNQLTEIDLQHLPPNLIVLRIGSNQFKQLNLQKLPSSLERIDLDNNQLISVNLQHLASTLTELYLNNNMLEQINLSRLPVSLKHIKLDNNRLKQIEMKHLPASLESLDISYNLLTEIDFNNLPAKIQTFSVQNNKLTKIVLNDLPPDISKLTINQQSLELLELLTCFVQRCNLDLDAIKSQHFESLMKVNDSLFSIQQFQARIEKVEVSQTEQGATVLIKIKKND